MLKKTLQVGSASRVRVTAAPGDLRVAGWDQDEVSARTDGDVLDLILNDNEVTVACDGDLILSIPRRLPLNLETVSGDADVRELSSGVAIREVEGDLALRMVGASAVGTVMGDMEARESGPLTVDDLRSDLSVRGGKGDLSVKLVDGDVSLHEIQGNVKLDSVTGDLYVRGVNGNMDVRVEGDAVLYLQPAEGRAVSVYAEGDILLHMSARVNAALTLSAGDADDIRVEMPGVPKRDGTNPRSVVLGNGGAAINLQAEGDVMVTSRESEWASAAEFDFGGSWPLPDDFSERINRRVMEATERAQRHAEAATRRAEESVRRAEANLRRQHGRRFSFNWSAGRPPSAPPVEPVSDVERMAILKMLQEKKITAEDAEKLLSALEGGK
ncbi:MAG: SHOCT-like domain-containing protein [Chloroflexota bacterium]